ncbi:uncharacterized protein CLUP02_07945 [Colletotrichum lupini]|uniref:Uncharacterized protein n=1 Tax=Colletotrichum lupini TaxID=145971 RepID=A0A9Q8STU1_9PEZI|nr:uncharacterized protein CLUP02_07945 [Colletotrichum lupini]UQC82457.1 hypothetical protein CLUP02_07945 [Colletotrichum lupini]
MRRDSGVGQVCLGEHSVIYSVDSLTRGLERQHWYEWRTMGQPSRTAPKTSLVLQYTRYRTIFRNFLSHPSLAAVCPADVEATESTYSISEITPKRLGPWRFAI